MHIYSKMYIDAAVFAILLPLLVNTYPPEQRDRYLLEFRAYSVPDMSQTRGSWYCQSQMQDVSPFADAVWRGKNVRVAVGPILSQKSRY